MPRCDATVNADAGRYSCTRVGCCVKDETPNGGGGEGSERGFEEHGFGVEKSLAWMEILASLCGDAVMRRRVMRCCRQLKNAKGRAGGVAHSKESN